MATSPGEDYVKAIYHLQEDSPAREATVVGIAATLGVTKGSVTAMVRKLKEAELAAAERYSGITLTPKGRALAIDMIRRHRLIEVFLVETLGFDWAEVHEEAERLEHAMSKKVLDRLDAFLEHPSTDPHGDPIPDAHGRLRPSDSEALSTLSKGTKGTVCRISDQDPAFLAFAAKHGLTPGTRVTVIDVTPEAESLIVKPARRDTVSMSLSAAGKVHVTTKGA